MNKGLGMFWSGFVNIRFEYTSNFYMCFDLMTNSLTYVSTTLISLFLY